jgi:hypothetical protein
MLLMYVVVIFSTCTMTLVHSHYLVALSHPQQLLNHDRDYFGTEYSSYPSAETHMGASQSEGHIPVRRVRGHH